MQPCKGLRAHKWRLQVIGSSTVRGGTSSTPAPGNRSSNPMPLQPSGMPRSALTAANAQSGGPRRGTRLGPLWHLAIQDLRVALDQLVKASAQHVHGLPALLCQECGNTGCGLVAFVVHDQKLRGVALAAMQLWSELVPVDLRRGVVHSEGQATALKLLRLPQVQEHKVAGLIHGRVRVHDADYRPRHGTHGGHARGRGRWPRLRGGDRGGTAPIGGVISRAQRVDALTDLPLLQQPHEGRWADALEDLISVPRSGRGAHQLLFLCRGAGVD
eukprot:CAMPEP_0179048186 /NCGR_PEP_ID=MMETSP0796-20121207/19582_1 /TAXON_ID=73915 /ORGANISM="Pyrodinium bahamense, Strain pbaha01" /LENGTH=271 /DNA_ID=CAMNT_0020744653 /DNA_START=29 /DNA_END=845 /DNA_ORIENTATION=-